VPVHHFGASFVRGQESAVPFAGHTECNNEFQILFDQKVKKEFYSAINDLVASSAYTIIASAINKANYIKQYGKLASDVYEIALSFILERSIFFLMIFRRNHISSTS